MILKFTYAEFCHWGNYQNTYMYKPLTITNRHSTLQYTKTKTDIILKQKQTLRYSILKQKQT